MPDVYPAGMQFYASQSGTALGIFRPLSRFQGDLILFGPDGDALWSRHFEGRKINDFEWREDGGLIVVGGSDQKAAWLASYDTSGEVTSERELTDCAPCISESIQYIQADKYAVSGQGAKSGGAVGWVRIIDSGGGT